jgi:4-hydroxybutyryl-CoA dehydratase/vinylacetyl-CoA-Delta-isomerase
VALRTPEQYVESLRDGRVIYFRGQRVDDVTRHPRLKKAVQHAEIDYRMAEDPRYRDLVVAERDDQRYSRYYALPLDAEDLRLRSRLIEAATREGKTLVVLIKEIGTDALFALHLLCERLDRERGTDYLERVRRFYAHCRDRDLALAVAQTDVKGDRSLAPSDQANPDSYVRIVEERPDGIVVRGAKCHTSVSANANELIVLPTRALGQKDRAYAVSFAVPLNAPGLTLVASPHGTAEKNPFEHPLSAERKMLETTTIFEDVFVPRERVFLQGEWEYAGPLALTFVEYHRFTAVSYKLPLVDALVGAAALMAEYNGIERAGHVRDKLTWLIAYAETVRGLTEAAAARCSVQPPGLAVPDPLLVNMAKWHFAGHYHQAVAHVQDLTGGLTVTGPAWEDLQHPQLGERLRALYGGKTGVGGEQRLRAINLVGDLTASDYGGYQEVLAIHAEGSIEAEKLTILRSYDHAAAKRYARALAGIDEADA